MATNEVTSLESCLDLRHYVGTRLTGDIPGSDPLLQGSWEPPYSTSYIPKPIRRRSPHTDGRTKAWMRTRG